MKLFDKGLEKSKEFGIPLYLTVFGSHLYGTNTENSDKDYKGLFLPSIKKLVLDEKVNSISLTTGENNSKNSSDDEDVQLWALQYWLKLLAKGDTNAIDLLGSMYSSHNEKIVDLDFLGKYKDNPMSLIDLKHNKAYVAYAFGQAKKYGLKGSRVGILKDILNYLMSVYSNPQDTEYWKAGRVFDEILEKFYNPSLCFEKKTDSNRFLYICGKGYMDSISLSEMIHRLDDAYNKYGNRAKQAEQNENIDWKAVSHAIRCLDQVIEMAETGCIIKYPLKTAPYILEVKQGKYSWNEVEKVIVEKLSLAEDLISKVKENSDLYQVHREIILTSYERYFNISFC